MTLRIIHTDEENIQQVETFTNVKQIQFEDQRYLNNGMYLHIYREKEVFSIEFEPTYDWFDIFEDKEK